MRTGAPIPGGGESTAQLRDRALRTVAEIAEGHWGGRVGAISHGGTLSCLYRSVTGKDLPRVPTNASLHRLIVERRGKGGLHMRFASWNETAHLEEGSFNEDAFEGKHD